MRGPTTNMDALLRHYENGDMPFCDVERRDVLVLANGVIVGRIPTVERAISSEEWKALDDAAGGSDMWFEPVSLGSAGRWVHVELTGLQAAPKDALQRIQSKLV